MNMSGEASLTRWSAKGKTALVIKILQGMRAVSQASRSFDLSPSKIESWGNDTEHKMDIEGEPRPGVAARAPQMPLRVNPLALPAHTRRKVVSVTWLYGEAMLELRV